jgi:hypothetical protein
MIENWIDKLAENCGKVYAGQGRSILSYKLFGNTELPESLSVFPCCLTFPGPLRSSYSASGVCTNIWQGTTEFHLTSDLNRKKLPEVVLFYKRIRDQFAVDMSLGGSVAYCILDPEGESISEPTAMRWGGENEHFGLIVHWVVKEVETGITVS